MRRWALRVVAGAALAAGVTAQAPGLTCFAGCAAGRYGCHCEHACRCASTHACVEGPGGDGRCLCRYGEWAACGERSPLRAGHWDDAPVEPFSVRAPARTGLEVFSLPDPAPGPARLVVADDAALVSALGSAWQPALLPLLSGAVLPRGAEPFARAYGGTQFGVYAEELGDGRVVQLGVVVRGPAACEAGPALELALKGCGRTFFSRGGDGRATLTGSLRELLGGVHIAAQGIPSARVLAVFAPGPGAASFENVLRDPSHSERYEPLPAAWLARVAPSWLRIGSLQFAARRLGRAAAASVARSALATIAALEASGDAAASGRPGLGLLEPSAAARARCFFTSRGGVTASCAARAAATDDDELALSCLLQRTAERTGALVAAWDAAGIVHGALNTDNISLVGTTIDVNVMGIAATLNLSYTPSVADAEEGRYSLGRQRAAAREGVEQLAEATGGDRVAAHAVFDSAYGDCFVERLCLRLGIARSARGAPELALAFRDLFVRAAEFRVDYHALSAALGAHVAWDDDGLWAARALAAAAAEPGAIGSSGLVPRLAQLVARLAQLVPLPVRAVWSQHIAQVVPAVLLRPTALRLAEQGHAADVLDALAHPFEPGRSATSRSLADADRAMQRANDLASCGAQ
jgi:uncharacterized protein YdiU (UPF0061 family)